MRNQFNFFVAASNLRAKMFGIKGRTDEEYFRKVMKDILVPDFTPRVGVKIADSDETKDGRSSDTREGISNNEMTSIESQCSQIFRELPKPSELAGFKLNPIDFDKDIDEHMLFVTACSNLRAMNYSIPTEDTHQSRAIAGKIIPAIATTTALVAGLVCLELYKVAGTARKKLALDAYKNCFVNLAVPFMTLSEPSAPVKTKVKLKGAEWSWTAWDSIDVTMGDISLRQLMKYFETEYNLEISMLSHGVSILYSFFANKKKIEERMDMSMSRIVTSITKKEFPTDQIFIILEVIANDLDSGEEIEIPYIKFRFR